MRASTSSSLFLFAFVATNVAAQYTNQSALFSLVLTSSNSSLNGSVLAPCHEGAAIEGLCVSPPPPSISSSAFFQFNTSSNLGEVDAPNDGSAGVLTYSLDVGSFNLSSPMELSVSYISNVATALFTPGESTTYVSFDDCDKMNIQGFPANIIEPEESDYTAYYRWYACQTDYLGYDYQTLNWKIGSGSPDNPTCGL